MMPARYPLNLYRGDSYQWRVVIWLDSQRSQPFDLANATVMAEIRNAPGGARIFELLCTVVLPNAIDIKLPAALCQTLPATGVWDLQIMQGGGIGSGPLVATVLRGDVTVVDDVTMSEPVHIAPGGAASLAAFPKRGVRVA